MKSALRAPLLGGLFFVLGLLVPVSSPAFDFPPPMGAVNDFADIIPSSDRQFLEGLAREVLQKTGASLVVATFENLGGLNLELFASNLFSTWGIGKKGEDRGLLMLVALRERKFRIETGYGLEGILPDGLAGRIRDEYFLPHFKKNNFGEGFRNGMSAIALVIAKDAGVTLTGNLDPQGEEPEPLWSKIVKIVVMAIILILIIWRNWPTPEERKGRWWMWPILFFWDGGGSDNTAEDNDRFGGFGGGSGGGSSGGGFGGFLGGMSGGGGASGGF